MATAPKILASGQVADAPAAIFTATSNTVVRLVSFKHVAGGTQLVKLSVDGGTARAISQAELETDEFAHEDEVITLESGDSLVAETTDAASVDYAVMGAEFT